MTTEREELLQSVLRGCNSIYGGRRGEVNANTIRERKKTREREFGLHRSHASDHPHQRSPSSILASSCFKFLIGGMVK